MILTVVHIILGFLLIIAIFLQGKGGWLTKKWAGESFRSKRGVEKTLFFLTILLAALFLISSILVIITT